jgi:hypothetical protein
MAAANLTAAAVCTQLAVLLQGAATAAAVLFSMFGRMLGCRLAAAAACVAVRHTQQTFHPSNAVGVHLQPN